MESTVDVQTLLALAGALGMPALGGLVWLLRALGRLGTGLESLKATVDAFGLKLDGLASEQDKARDARSSIHSSLADHDKRLALTERDVERWLAGTYAPAGLA